MEFVKMQGCGNDFIFFVYPKSFKSLTAGCFIQEMCDRHKGIGADGIILVLPPTGKLADFKMRIFNSDGSEAEMCGNGIRCFGKLVFEKGLTGKRELNIETLKSIIPIKLFSSGKRVSHVNAKLSKPELITPLAPGFLSGILDFKFDKVYRVSMGNPHCVIFTPVKVEYLALDKYGPLIEKHRLFPGKTNVEFVNILSRTEIRLRVWERGAGETLACGSGACAAVATGICDNKLSSKNVKVRLPGGDLTVSWAKDAGLIMDGPAEFVYSGEVGI